MMAKWKYERYRGSVLVSFLAEVVGAIPDDLDELDEAELGRVKEKAIDYIEEFEEENNANTT